MEYCYTYIFLSWKIDASKCFDLSQKKNGCTQEIWSQSVKMQTAQTSIIAGVVKRKEKSWSN